MSTLKRRLHLVRVGCLVSAAACATLPAAASAQVVAGVLPEYHNTAADPTVTVNIPKLDLSNLDPTKFDPSSIQLPSVQPQGVKCTQQLDPIRLGVDGTGAGIEFAGLAAEIVTALDPSGVTEAISIGAQVGGYFTRLVALGLEVYPVAAGLPNCNTDVLGGMKITQGGIDVSGDSAFRGSLGVGGALGVAGDVFAEDLLVDSVFASGPVSAWGGDITLGTVDLTPPDPGISIGGGAIAGAGHFGPQSISRHPASIAIGNGSQANQEGSIALGTLAFSDNFGTTAVGYRARATGAGATALGNGSTASGANSVALGNAAQSGGSDSVAIGYEAVASFDESVSLGGKAMSGNTGTTAVGHGANATGSGATALGKASTAGGASSVALGNGAQAQGDDSVAIGNGATASGGAAVAIGLLNTANGNGAVAIGDPNAANGRGAIALGADNTATGEAAIAMGADSSATGDGAQATGLAATANGTSAIASGNNTSANGERAVALGGDAAASAESAVAIGAGASAAYADSAAIGPGAASTRSGQIALGSASSTVTMPGLTSAASRAAQVGTLGVVTTDALGNLASDGGRLAGASLLNRQGVALGIAMQNPDLTGNENGGLAFNWGQFEGADAFSISGTTVLARNIFGPGKPGRIAISASLGVAGAVRDDTYRIRKNESVATRVGGQITW